MKNNLKNKDDEIHEFDEHYLFRNPIMRSYIKLNNKLESIQYEEAYLLETEI